MTARRLLLLTVLVLPLLVGCQGPDWLRLRITSVPPAANLSYRVVSTTGQPKTDWILLGQTPYHGQPSVHPAWSAPDSIVELKVERAGFQPLVWGIPSTELHTEHRNVTRNATLLRADAGPAPDPQGP